MLDQRKGCMRGPLDWIKAPEIGFLISILEKKFDNFLLLENCQILGEEENYYRVLDKQSGYHSLHDFAVLTDDPEADVRNQYPTVKKKYLGIIHEFFIDLKETDHILFFMNLEAEWGNQEAPNCPISGLPYTTIIHRLITLLVKLRGGKPFDLLVGTYFNQLNQESWYTIEGWEGNIRFFPLDKRWKAFKSEEEVFVWRNALFNIEVKDTKMKKGWPNLQKNIYAEPGDRTIYNRVYSIGADYMPRLAIVDANLCARRGPFDRLVTSHIGQVTDLLTKDFEELFPLHALSPQPSHNDYMLNIHHIEHDMIFINEIPKTSEKDTDSLRTGYPEFVKKHKGIIQAFQQNLVCADNVLFLLNLQPRWERGDKPICTRSGNHLSKELSNIVYHLSNMREGRLFTVRVVTCHSELIEMEWPDNIEFVLVDKNMERSKENTLWKTILSDVFIDDCDPKQYWKRMDGTTAPEQEKI